MLDPWVASAPGTLPSPPALFPAPAKYHLCHCSAQPGQLPLHLLRNRKALGRAEKSWNVCWVTTSTGMAQTGQGKPDKDAGGEDSISWGEGYVGSKI